MPGTRTRPNTACYDEDGACGDWAAAGECDANPAFMVSSCRLSCRACSPFIEVGKHWGRNVTLVTGYGEIPVTLLWHRAPDMCALVAELAARGLSPGCNFYRNEGVPQDGSPGPPYALLQGVLGSLLRAPRTEATTSIERGHVATIHPGKDFYIALAPHADWSSAHTVWGRVFDMTAAEDIVTLPHQEVHHAVYQTAMRMLVTPVPFTLRLA